MISVQCIVHPHKLATISQLLLPIFRWNIMESKKKHNTCYQHNVPMQAHHPTPVFQSVHSPHGAVASFWGQTSHKSVVENLEELLRFVAWNKNWHKQIIYFFRRWFTMPPKSTLNINKNQASYISQVQRWIATKKNMKKLWGGFIESCNPPKTKHR